MTLPDDTDPNNVTEGMADALQGTADAGVLNQETEAPQTEVESPQTEVETPKVPAGHQVDGGEGGEEDGDKAAEAPDYEPDYAFTVHGEKREFDDWAKELVKDEESNAFFKDVMNKVHGIEHIKADREQLRTDLTTEKESRQGLNQSLGNLGHYLKTDNMEAFFRALKIPESQVLRYATQRIQYRDMSAEQRTQYDQNFQGQIDQRDLQQRNENLSAQNNQFLLDARGQEVDLVLSREDISEFANAYDARMGKEGAFRDEVWNRGRMHAAVYQKDISAEDAVNEVLQLVGGPGPQAQPGIPQGGQLNPAPPQAMPNPGAQTMPTEKPVIPKVEGSGASPTRPVIKSLKDLRTRRMEKFGS